jgi:hypothetical protein
MILYLLFSSSLIQILFTLSYLYYILSLISLIPYSLLFIHILIDDEYPHYLSLFSLIYSFLSPLIIILIIPYSYTLLLCHYLSSSLYISYILISVIFLIHLISSFLISLFILITHLSIGTNPYLHHYHYH